MKCFRDNKFGFTIVELMVTIVIVTILATSLGVFFVKLLTIQEREREEAYIREKLSDVCAVYADYLSIGSSISTNFNQQIFVNYRQETGGVSFETGKVSHVIQLTSTTNAMSQTLDLSVDIIEDGNIVSKQLCRISGDAQLIPLVGSNLVCSITPFGSSVDKFPALRTLRLTTWYKYKNGDGDYVITNAVSERIVRLWNWEDR